MSEHGPRKPEDEQPEGCVRGCFNEIALPAIWLFILCAAAVVSVEQDMTNAQAAWLIGAATVIPPVLLMAWVIIRDGRK